jgi:serine protease inhibitor
MIMEGFYMRESSKRRLMMWIGILCLASITIITGCGNSPAPHEKVMELPELEELSTEIISSDFTSVVEANRAFGLDWFSALDEGNHANMIVSPYSASMALAMTLRGADGDTYKEIAQVLHAKDLSEVDYHLQQASLLRHLVREIDDITLLTANSIWHTKTLPVSTSFIEQIAQYYGARISGVDFSDSQTPKQMNKWVSDHTKGKIKSIVPDEIQDEPFMYLMNALYLNAPWNDPFQESHTEEETFQLQSGEQIKVPMMKQNHPMQAIDSSDFIAVRKNLGDNSELSMTLILPEEGKDWSDVQKKLKENATWKDTFKTYSVDLAFPKFKIEQEINFIESLKTLGIHQLFDPRQADLSRMAGASGPQLFVDEAIQKTYIDVNEDGVEAAAVTSIRAYPTSMPEPISAKFDRPFYFVIEDNESSAILFVGVVRDPRG